MRCPRCQQPTHVVNTRWKGYIVRRERVCGLVKGGKPAGPTCKLKFATMEMPVGYTADVQIKLTQKGFEAEVK
jgi:transcriptional regulator NrdR family protein